MKAEIQEEFVGNCHTGDGRSEELKGNQEAARVRDRTKQWCAGVWFTTGSRKKLWCLVFQFGDVNTPTMASFKLPTWGNWTWRWEEMCAIGFCELVCNSSSSPLVKRHQHTSRQWDVTGDLGPGPRSRRQYHRGSSVSLYVRPVTSLFCGGKYLHSLIRIDAIYSGFRIYNHHNIIFLSILVYARQASILGIEETEMNKITFLY